MSSTANAPLSYDVVIIGGGPGGATTGGILAQAGKKVLICERTKFPRFHIGESLIPETYWTLKRLGMLPKMRNSHFIKKYSVQFVNASGKESQPFYFDEMNPHECSQTWQVVRSEFDQMMLENARELGAEVWEQTNVIDVLTEPAANDFLPRLTGIIAQREGGQPQQINAKVVVDATGTNAMLSKKWNIRKGDPKLRKAAVFAHYKNAQRDPGKNGGATLVLAIPEHEGWFWYIPLHDDIMSVGAVGDLDYMITTRQSPEETLAEEIAKTPAMAKRLENATRVSPVRVIQDYSYRASRCAGEGWVLVGDAFGFLDPMYSSGVFIALKSGECAADTIIEAFDKNDFSAVQLSKWGDYLSGGMQSIRRLVYCYYTKGFSFGKFVRAHPDTVKNITDLLIGNVFYDGVNDVFAPLNEFVPVPPPVPLDRPPGAEVPVEAAK
jgi:flavin-dependent dehydrogenase